MNQNNFDSFELYLLLLGQITIYSRPEYVTIIK